MRKQQSVKRGKILRELFIVIISASGSTFPQLVRMHWWLGAFYGTPGVSSHPTPSAYRWHGGHNHHLHHLLFRCNLGMVLHVWNWGMEKGCSQHGFTYVHHCHVSYFWLNCKTIELMLLPAAKQEWEREKERKVMGPPICADWKVFHTMSTPYHLDGHDIGHVSNEHGLIIRSIDASVEIPTCQPLFHGF